MDAARGVWEITERWQNYLGEIRVNLFRFLAILVFYGLHTLNYAGGLPSGSPLVSFWQIGARPTAEFHLQATLIAVAWLLSACAIHVLLVSRRFPRWLPPAALTLDLSLLTFVLCIGTGPRSPLVVAYLLVQVLAALRFDRRLLRLATVGALCGYLIVLGRARWIPATASATTAAATATTPLGADDLTIPRYAQLVFVATVLLVGAILQQLLQRSQALAIDYSQRLADNTQRETQDLS